ncbi:GNAT family N-acetyltransferase [Agromyces sp. CFH 90414]|uniref:Lysine N-acyltransferase MbtK n=1 Tax=Agromyces agglutinans TaxID=2662258 RepID=A0A6I2F0P7_9MICO|nr:GNAT family N-acetyltransferase [Agromyces agglutinans]MRG59015.1 GNAT family N-acetyltransferase [Agromyces agglutinans]
MSLAPSISRPAPATPAFAVAFVRDTPAGRLGIAPVDPDRDAAVLHAWLTDPHSAFWQMGGLSADEVLEYFRDVAADPDQQAWIGLRDGEPAFLVETYDPARVLLADVHDAEPGDVGMHLLVSPPRPDAPRVHGLTSAVMATVVRFCFDGLGARRVVVEPDVRNAAIARKNAEVGFRVLREVDLPGKRANLSVLEHAWFEASAPAHLPTPGGSAIQEARADTPAEASADRRVAQKFLNERADAPERADVSGAPHLTPETMAAAQRHLVAKAIAEFAHERLLAPIADADEETGAGEPTDAAAWVVETPVSRYRFRARRHALEHWAIDEATLERTVGGEPADLDAQAFVAELQAELGIPDALLATYLEEIASTLASAAFKLHRGGLPAAELAVADFQSIEAGMTEGHPGFVANNGRIGFGLAEFAAYAPEAAASVRLVWLAVRKATGHLALGAGLTEGELYESELGGATLARFDERLRGLGLDPEEYRYLPVHPWQWQHRIAITFAPDVARRDLVHLGEGDDEYRAQQSIRTFFNVARPDRSYVKTALAIQNMGFLRGLSPAYMRATPAINDWVATLVDSDATLRAGRFEVLREHASIGYTGDAYHRTATPSPHRKMIAALWRESPVPRLAPGERLATMAALLHRDASGASIATALVRASGLPAREWVAAYLDAYLRPVVHCLLAYDLAFMPHGENLILVLDGHVPRRVFMKDIGEEVAVLSDRIALPEDVARIRAVVDDRERALAIFTDVFDGVLRHLAAILDGDGTLPEAEFWRLVAACVDRHASEHPDLDSSVDLRADRFAHSCLNRLQLRNTLQMVDLASQSASLLYAGTMANPIGRSSVPVGAATVDAVPVPSAHGEGAFSERLDG